MILNVLSFRHVMVATLEFTDGLALISPVLYKYLVCHVCLVPDYQRVDPSIPMMIITNQFVS